MKLFVFLFNKQLGTSEPVNDWQALTTSMLFVLNNLIIFNVHVKMKVDLLEDSLSTHQQ